MAYCPNCGQQNPDGIAVCPNCGGPLGAPPTAYSPPAPVTGAGETSGKATASLVLGIVGIFFMILLIPQLLAVIFGHLAKSDIRRSGGRISGNGMATAGLVLGYVGLASIAITPHSGGNCYPEPAAIADSCQ